MPYPVNPQLVASDIIQIVVRITCKSQIALNTYWYKKPALGIAQDLYPALADWQSQAKPKYLPLLPSIAFYKDTLMYVNFGGIWSEAYFSNEVGEAGTATGTLLPTQVSGIITRRVDAKGPKNRGRVYIPFPSESFLGSDERPSDAYVDALVDLASTVMPLTAAMTVGGEPWEPGLCRRSNAVATYQNLMDVRSHKAWATQRRRGDYGTPNVNT